MFNDSRNIDIINPDEYFAYTAPSTTPKTILYILKKDLENMKNSKIPQRDNFTTGRVQHITKIQKVIMVIGLVSHIFLK